VFLFVVDAFVLLDIAHAISVELDNGIQQPPRLRMSLPSVRDGKTTLLSIMIPRRRQYAVPSTY
jgi:hypothetical protein